MSFELIVFYLFAGLTLTSAFLVIVVRNPVHAALSLILCFFSSAGLWLLLEAEFLAIVLVLVYVGAVMVLFMFVVMMLDINLAEIRKGFLKYLALALVVVAPMILIIGTVASSSYFDMPRYSAAVKQVAGHNNTYEIGKELFTKYVWPFEIAAVILLVAIVAAIALTLRTTRQLKNPNVEQQLSVERDKRIRLVDMGAE